MTAYFFPRGARGYVMVFHSRIFSVGYAVLFLSMCVPPR